MVDGWGKVEDGKSTMGIERTHGRILPTALWLLEDIDFYDY